MRGKVKKQGKYELFETTKGHQILTLNENEWYALVEGQQGDIIVHSDSEHEKKRTIQKGEFYLADFEDDPEFKDMPHLFMEKGKKFAELILPNGLPTKSNYQKKLVRTDEKIAKGKIREHIHGKGDRGGEKQYKGEPERLREKTREELYDRAKRKGIEGRSRMNKEELVQHLQDK